MKNIPLYVLDEYAKRLSNSQVKKLYEAKTHQEYKPLYEKLNDSYKLYLNAYTINEELNTNKSGVIMMLTEKSSDLMENISYKINDDSITFLAESRDVYGKLINSLLSIGIYADTIEEIRDKKW